MSLPSRQHLVELVIIVGLKAASLILMGYVMVFLALFGGLEGLGLYSAVTAVTAPLAMFCMFRHVEWLALSEKKSEAFSVAVVVAIAIFLVLAIPAIYFLSRGGISKGFLLVLVAYKPLEMLNDFFSSLLVCLGDKTSAFFSMALKMAGVLLVTAAGLALGLGRDSMPLLVASALLISFAVVFVSYDAWHIRGRGLFTRPTFGQAQEYVHSNFKFGLLNMGVSFNSSLPRYYLMYVGNLSALGLFSLVYQLAAAMVNVIQYPVSVKVAAIRDYVGARRSLLDGVLVLAALTMLAVVVIFAYITLPEDWHLLPLLSRIGFVSVVVILMFVFLMLRGVMLSLAIAANAANGIYGIVVGSSVMAGATLFLLLQLDVVGLPLLLSFLFVMFSSFFSVAVLIVRLNGVAGQWGNDAPAARYPEKP